jgi:dTDP-4-amino-4,6-dideoxygalactose transaminase
MNRPDTKSYHESREDRFWPVSIFPGLSVRQLFADKQDQGFPFSAERFHWSLNARSALWHGLELMGLKPGDSVLVPVYSCGSELDAILARNLGLEFYAIDKHLNANLDSMLAARTESTRAILVTHYFGFGQPLDDIMCFARRYGLFVIEDNAHGLFSSDDQGRPLGSRGDASIFSMYKSVAVPDGGALVINSPNLESSEKPNRPSPPFHAQFGPARVLLERSVAANSPKAARTVSNVLLDPVVRAAKAGMRAVRAGDQVSGYEHEVSASASSFSEIKASYGISAVSRFILGKQLAAEIVSKRRSNFAALAETIDAVDDLQLLFPTLDQGCAPLFLPVLERDESRPFRRAMLDAGIECHGFGFERECIPSTGFEWESRLKSCVTCLPVHQGLSAENTEYVHAVIRKFGGL